MALDLLRPLQEAKPMRIISMYTTTALIVSTVIAVSAQSRSTQNHQHQSQNAITGNVAHGEYIVERVAMCIECHSPRDENGRIIHGQEFMGASLPTQPPPGWATRAPRNRGLPGYSDFEAMRLLTGGHAIARDGRQLQPPMPRFRMTESDAADVIAFLRSLP